MPKRKISATQRNINSINSYIRNVAETFGTTSSQYVALQSTIIDFDIRWNKSGIVQIKNNKENRKQHQKIRALRNRQKQHRNKVSVMKKKVEQEIREWNNIPEDEDIFDEDIREFERMQYDNEQWKQHIYDIVQALNDEFGVYIDNTQISKALDDREYGYQLEQTLEQLRKSRDNVNKRMLPSDEMIVDDEFSNDIFDDWTDIGYD